MGDPLASLGVSGSDGDRRARRARRTRRARRRGEVFLCSWRWASLKK